MSDSRGNSISNLGAGTSGTPPGIVMLEERKTALAQLQHNTDANAAHCLNSNACAYAFLSSRRLLSDLCTQAMHNRLLGQRLIANVSKLFEEQQHCP